MELVHQKDSKKTAPTINTKNAASSIKCLYTNADTLTNKMPELKVLIEEHKPLIIAITEVIPKKFRFPVQKAEVKVSNEYEVFSGMHLKQRERNNNPSSYITKCPRSKTNNKV